MPTTSRLRVQLVGAAVLALPLLALAVPGTAEAGAPVAAASPSPCTLVISCPTETPTPEPTESAEPTPSATASPTPTATLTATPAPRRTSSSPRPRSTFTVPSGGFESPVTGTVQIGGVAVPSQSATTAPETEESSSSVSGLTRLLVLVIGAAVLLGVSGATGLYLTRHRHD